MTSSAVTLAGTVPLEKYYAPEDGQSWPELILETSRVVKNPLDSTWKSIHSPEGSNINSKTADVAFDLHLDNPWCPLESYFEFRGQVWLAKPTGAVGLDTYPAELENMGKSTILAPAWFLQRIQTIRAYLDSNKISDTTNAWRSHVISRIMNTGKASLMEQEFESGWTFNPKSDENFPMERIPPWITPAEAKTAALTDRYETGLQVGDEELVKSQRNNLVWNETDNPANVPAGIWASFHIKVPIVDLFPSLNMQWMVASHLRTEFSLDDLTRGIFTAMFDIPGDFTHMPYIHFDEWTFECMNMLWSAPAKAMIEKQILAGKSAQRLVPTYSTNLWTLSEAWNQTILNKVFYAVRPQTKWVFLQFYDSTNNDGKHRFERGFLPKFEWARVLKGSKYYPQEKQNFDSKHNMYKRMYDDTANAVERLTGKRFCLNYRDWCRVPLIGFDLSMGDTNEIKAQLQLVFECRLSEGLPVNTYVAIIHIDIDRVDVVVNGTGQSAQLVRLSV